MEDHQFARPTNAAIAGTVMVRTTKVSMSKPAPMMNPVCTIVEMLPNNKPNMEAAKMMPAEVMTPPVERTARTMPVRIPAPDSSRMRVDHQQDGQHQKRGSDLDHVHITGLTMDMSPTIAAWPVTSPVSAVPAVECLTVSVICW